jgi:cytochrome o ubiquinol oxidase subunit II
MRYIWKLLAACGGILASSYAISAGMLDPKGIIALEQRTLLFNAVLIMLIVVVPVIIMSFVFAYRYRSTARKGDYKPDWHHSTLLECFWWGIPTIIILILGIIVWNKTHELDPYHEINVAGEKERIEVVALSWKWLFIYPKENIAAVNELYLPAGKQVEFYITADAPMSAFSIPQLAGQIYAMAGMRTRLHIYSDQIGNYEGLNTQLSGYGFADMHFTAHVVDQNNFDAWVKTVKQSKKSLDVGAYKKLFKTDASHPIEHYTTVKPDLFSEIMLQYNNKIQWLH